MAYRDPHTVVAPKTRWKLDHVLCNTGQDGWSAAEGIFDENNVLAIRWNGSDETDGPGNPQSHGQPTWFIMPEELREAVADIARSLEQAHSQVVCEITRPKGYDWGAWRVVIRLQGEIVDAFEGHEPTFAFPQLPNRFFRSAPEFVAPPLPGEKRHRGKLLGGRWEGIVQTNGIDEDSNETPLTVTRDALIANVAKSLEPWSAVRQTKYESRTPLQARKIAPSS